MESGISEELEKITMRADLEPAVLSVLIVPLQGAFALARANRSAGGEHAPRNPCYTLHSSV